MHLRLLGVLATLLTAAMGQPAQSPLGSRVFAWDDLRPFSTGVGERRDVCDQPTRTLQRFESHISTLNPGLASHPPHTHPQEELIILERGSLDVFINGEVTRVGPGSVFWFASNDPHAVNNRGTEPATYFVFNFETASTRAQPGPSQERPVDQPRLESQVWNWSNLAPTATATGERRAMAAGPTATCRKFSCHATTLRPGAAPHPSHRHADEEILLIREGTLEVTINGQSQAVSRGSIVFIASGDEHGWRNVGQEDAVYYVIRVETEATPVL